MEDPAKEIEQVIVLLTTAVNAELQKATLLRFVHAHYANFDLHLVHLAMSCEDTIPPTRPFVIHYAAYHLLPTRPHAMPSLGYTNGIAPCLPSSR